MEEIFANRGKSYKVIENPFYNRKNKERRLKMKKLYRRSSVQGFQTSLDQFIPQMGFGSVVNDGSGQFLLDRLDGLSRDLGFATYTAGQKSTLNIFFMEAQPLYFC